MSDHREPSASSASAAKEDFALFRRFPELRTKLPRLRLTTLPTPIERAAALEPNDRVAIYIKRDDRSAQLYGGGKPRKLELLLAEAQQQQAKRLITVGGVASHHALATTLFGRQLGLPTTVYLLPQPPNDEVRHNLLALHAAGADMRSAGSYQGALAAARYQQQRAPHEHAQYIPAGGTTPRSTLAFVSAGLELAEQVRAGVMPEPDAIYLAMGTMGSAVGVALGLRLAGLSSRVVAVRVSNRNTSSRKKLRKLAHDTIVELRALGVRASGLQHAPDQLQIEDGYRGAGYGVATARGRNARAQAERATGLRLEDTYTAKTMAALLDAAERTTEGSPRVLLYWHSHDGRPPSHDGAAEDASIAALPAPFRAYFPRPPAAKQK